MKVLFFTAIIPVILFSCTISKLGQGWQKVEGGDYKGLYKDGVPHGQGIFVFDNGTQYEGMFENGLFHGEGILSLSDVIYTGMFEKGSFLKGSAKYKDETIYNGEFQEFKWHGTGELTYNNNVYTGLFQSGVMVQGTIEYPDKSIFSGIITNYQPSKGLIYFQDGSFYSGLFQDGKPKGKGEFYDANKETLTKGEFDGNQVLGEAYIIDKNNNVELVHLDNQGKNIKASLMENAAQQLVKNIEYNEKQKVEQDIAKIENEVKTTKDNYTELSDFKDNSNEIYKQIASECRCEGGLVAVSFEKEILDQYPPEYLKSGRFFVCSTTVDIDNITVKEIGMFSDKNKCPYATSMGPQPPKFEHGYWKSQWHNDYVGWKESSSTRCIDYYMDRFSRKSTTFFQGTMGESLERFRKEATKECKRLLEENITWQLNKKAKCTQLVHDFNNKATNIESKVANLKQELEQLSSTYKARINNLEKEFEQRQIILKEQREREARQQQLAAKEEAEQRIKEIELNKRKNCSDNVHAGQCISDCLRYTGERPCKGCVCQM